eukprot:683142-Rhodomonas_salina.31
MQHLHLVVELQLQLVQHVALLHALDLHHLLLFVFHHRPVQSVVSGQAHRALLAVRPARRYRQQLRDLLSRTIAPSATNKHILIMIHSHHSATAVQTMMTSCSSLSRNLIL